MKNPIRDKKFLYRVSRSGNWNDYSEDMRSSNRTVADSISRDYYALGFRIVRNK